MRFIQHGAADVMVAGSSESCIHPLCLGGFARARSLSTRYNDQPEKASRPFDKGRDGFVVGEGAGVMVLESLEHALERKAVILAEVMGYGATSDAWHMTAPRPDGEGARRAMGMVVKEAGVRVGEVGYVNAHATGTGLGDRAENRAVRGLFLGEERKTRLKVSSTKGSIGHLLGGAGSVEAIFAVLAVKTGVVPRNVNLVEFDGDDGGEEKGEWDDRIDYVPFRPGWEAEKARRDDGDVKVALSNSFGFGGTNASLCFRRWEG